MVAGTAVEQAPVAGNFAGVVDTESGVAGIEFAELELELVADKSVVLEVADIGSVVPEHKSVAVLGTAEPEVLGHNFAEALDTAGQVPDRTVPEELAGSSAEVADSFAVEPGNPGSLLPNRREDIELEVRYNQVGK